MATKTKQITLRLKEPNPLFTKWIKEWHEEAVARNSKMQHCYHKALISLKKYPLPLETGADCKILSGFGNTLCSMLDRKLAEHNNNRDLNETIDYRPTNMHIEDLTEKENTKPKKPKGSRISSENYVPTYRSGGYAILLALKKKSLEADYPGYLTKVDLIKSAKDYSDKSFTRADPGSYYTAWSSMKTLLTKGLVTKQGNPAKFSLTDTGFALAEKLEKNTSSDDDNYTKKDDKIDYLLSSNKPSTSQCPDIIEILDIPFASIRNTEATSTILSTKTSSWKKTSSSTSVTCSQGSSLKKTSSSTSVTCNQESSLKKTSSSTSVICSQESSSTAADETIIFSPFSFDIILLVDTQESTGDSGKEFLEKLMKTNVVYEVRHLKVGDYLWIARDSITKRELVLPYVIERKRMDDFGSSIKDGRFHEQKFRLKQSGVQNLIYLVESYGNNQHVGLPLLTLFQAASNTLVQDGFSVKFTDCTNSTVHYLKIFSDILSKQFKSKTLVSCKKNNLEKHSIQDDLISLMEFTEFNKISSKSRHFKVSEFFVRQLLQLKGLSVEKALAIVKEYPTPFLLKAAFEGSSQPEKMLANVRYGNLNKSIGPVISKCLYELYTKETF